MFLRFFSTIFKKTKKTQFSKKKKHKVRDFLFSMNDIWANIGQKCIFFLPTSSYRPNPTEKNFHGHIMKTRKINSKFLKKKTVFQKLEPRWNSCRFFFFFQKVRRFSIMSLAHKMAFWEGWKSQKSLQSQKMRFFQSMR